MDPNQTKPKPNAVASTASQQQKAKHTGTKLLNLSHEEIARDLATSRVVISRLLKKLENDDLLLLYRNQIKLLTAFEIEGK